MGGWLFLWEKMGFRGQVGGDNDADAGAAEPLDVLCASRGSAAPALAMAALVFPCLALSQLRAPK